MQDSGPGKTGRGTIYTAGTRADGVPDEMLIGW